MKVENEGLDTTVFTDVPRTFGLESASWSTVPLLPSTKLIKSLHVTTANFNIYIKFHHYLNTHKNTLKNRLYTNFHIDTDTHPRLRRLYKIPF